MEPFTILRPLERLGDVVDVVGADDVVVASRDDSDEVSDDDEVDVDGVGEV